MSVPVPPTAPAAGVRAEPGWSGGGADRRRAASLPAQARVLERIVDRLPDGVILAGPTGQLLLVNAAARRIVGPPPYEVCLADWPRAYGWFLPDGVTPCPASALPLARALAGETVADADVFVRNPGLPGGAWISASATPLTDEHAGAAGALLVLRDVTERKQSSDAIQRLSSAVEQTADSVFITDMDGTIVYVNPAFEQTTGFTREDALGRTPRLLKSGEHDAGFYRDLWETVLAGRVFRGVLVNRRKDGELFHCEQTITPIRAADGRRTNLLAVTRDITARLRAEHDGIEMELGRVVQQRLYPRSSLRVPGFDVAGAARPAATLCGDYFDHFGLPQGCLALATGDVSGHGIGPSLIMAQTRAYLRCLAATGAGMGDVLGQLNELLVADLAVERFVTLALVRLDPRAHTLVHASAGHVPGYLLDPRGEVRAELGSTGVPLGLFAGRRFASSRLLALEPGEIVVLLTDGVTESGGHEGGDEYGAERALAFVREHRGEPASAIAAGLCGSAREFAAHAPQVDDMTVLVCKVDDAPGRAGDG